MSTTFTLFNSFKAALSGKIDLSGHTFKCALTTSAQSLSAAGQAVYADLTAEVANGNGYTTGGEALTGVTWAQTSGTAKFDSNDPAFTASGSGFTCRNYVIYDDTATNKDLMGFGVLDNTPADVVLISGDTLTITVNANGWLSLS